MGEHSNSHHKRLSLLDYCIDTSIESIKNSLFPIHCRRDNPRLGLLGLPAAPALYLCLQLTTINNNLQQVIQTNKTLHTNSQQHV